MTTGPPSWDWPRGRQYTRAAVSLNGLYKHFLSEPFLIGPMLRQSCTALFLRVGHMRSSVAHTKIYILDESKSVNPMLNIMAELCNETFATKQ